MFLVTSDPLDAAQIVSDVSNPQSGAVALFFGVVRDHNLGRRVSHLEYDAYPPLAQRTMAEIAEETKARWPVSEVAIYHRTGRLEIGETSLLVAVASPHRAEAFEACHFCVDRVKQRVPVWKKEVWEGGEAWIEGTPVSPPQPA